MSITKLSLNDTGESVLRLQQWLNLLCVSVLDAPENGIFDEATRKAVTNFQIRAGIQDDGIYGVVTNSVLRDAVRRRYCELMRMPKYGLLTLPADKVGNGYGSFTLRTDAAFHYTELRNAAMQLGIPITSSGSLRSLYAPVSQGRVATSLHYLGIAFDLYIYSGLQNPQNDPYVVERDGDFWRVWARSNSPDVPEYTIANPVTEKARKGTGKPVTARFVDFTALAESHGFSRIRPHSSFLQGGSYAGAEWWHFQCERGLMPHFSTFGGELDTLFRQSEIDKSPVAKYQDRVFGENWG